MPIKNLENNNDYRELLSLLGIPSQLLPPNFSQIDYVVLYQRLHFLMNTFANSPLSLKIKESWQIYLLTGHIKLISEVKNDSPLISLSDHYGAGAAHYIALSGNPKALTWLKKHAPQLLEKTTVDHRETIAHYAALAGNLEVLNWIKKNSPPLLDERTGKWETIAHYAALAGNLEVLNWIKDNTPHLLAGITYPEEYTLADYAIRSKKTSHIKFALALSTVTKISLPDYLSVTIGEFNRYLQTTSKILDRNFTVTEVKQGQYICHPLIGKEIKGKLLINGAIKELIPSLMQLIIGDYEEGNQLYQLPRDILFDIFKRLLPSHTPIAKVKFLFNNMLAHFNPVNQLKRKVLDLIDHHIGCISTAQKAKKFGLIKGKQCKAEALEQIKKYLDKNYASVDELKQDVIKTFSLHQDTLNYRQNNGHSLFKSTHQSKDSNLIKDIYTLLAISLEPNLTKPTFDV